MEYFESSRGRPVYNLQTFLRTISKTDDRVYPVIPDGIFGKDTQRSVESFQQANGLEVTGEADAVTWDAIVASYEASKKILAPVHGIKIITNEQVIKRGENAPAVYIIQSMIVSLSDKISNIKSVPISGVYDEFLYAEIKNLKPMFGQSGENIDKEFINFLSALYEHCVIFKPDYYEGKVKENELVDNAAHMQADKTDKSPNDKGNVIVWKFF